MGNSTSKPSASETDLISSSTHGDFDDVEPSGVQGLPVVLDDPHRVNHDQAALSKTSGLCHICFNVLNDTSEYASTRYHSSLLSLEQSVGNGCHLCSLVRHFLPERPPHQLDEFLTLLLRRDGGLLMAGWRHQAVSFNLVRRWDLTKFEQRYYQKLESEAHGTTHTYKEFATTMLQHCISHHPRCHNENVYGWSPSRLIEIDSNSASTKLRLVTSKPQEPYVALSHCWGTIHTFKLLAENLESMKVGIDLSVLPKTFLDAITICTWLNVRYLWIDSCCIVQDSHEDWLEESAMMDNVYRNAHCTIAADCAADSSVGCIIAQNPLTVRPCTVFDEGIPVLCLPPEALLEQHFEREPLEQRAWALQERMLSPRILHCTTDQLFWECNEEFKCQTYPHDLQAKGNFRKVPRMMKQSFLHTNLHLKWNGVIEDYCKRSLTREEDKLVALSGVAKAFQSYLSSDVYLAGLWYKSMPHSLMWQVVDPKLVTRPSSYRAPSWSWASLDGRIIPNNEETKMDTSQIYLDVLSCDVNLVSEDSTGQARGGSLEVYGLMKRALWCDASQDIVLGEELLDSNGEIQKTPLRTSGFSYFPDSEAGTADLNTKAIYCLLIRSKGTFINGLVLCSTDNPDRFMRLGVFQAKGAAACIAIKYNLRPSYQHILEESWGWNTDDDSITEFSSSFKEQRISAINIALPTTGKRSFKTRRDYEVGADKSLSISGRWNKGYENTLPSRRLLESGVWNPSGTILQRPSAPYGASSMAGGFGPIRQRTSIIETPWRPMGNEIPIQLASSRKSKAKKIHAVYQGKMTDPLNIYQLDPPYSLEQFERLVPRTVTLI